MSLMETDGRCEDCGEELGTTCDFVPDDFDWFDGCRVLVVQGGWSGCEACIKHAKQQAEKEADYE